jgi:hypothetical protein
MREPFAAEAVAGAYAEMGQAHQESAIPTIARHYAERTQLDDVDALAGIRYSRETFYGLQPQHFEALVRWAEWGAPLLLLGLGLAPGLLPRTRSGRHAPART